MEMRESCTSRLRGVFALAAFDPDRTVVALSGRRLNENVRLGVRLPKRLDGVRLQDI